MEKLGDITPLIALLGYTKDIPKRLNRLTSMALLLAKRGVSMAWGRGTAPRFKEWLKDIALGAEMLDTYATLLPRSSRPCDFWGPVLAYLMNLRAESSSPPLR